MSGGSPPCPSGPSASQSSKAALYPPGTSKGLQAPTSLIAQHCMR